MNLKKEISRLSDNPAQWSWQEQIEEHQKQIRKIVSKLKENTLKNWLSQLLKDTPKDIITHKKQKEITNKIKNIKEWAMKQDNKTLEQMLTPGPFKKALITAAAIFTITTSQAGAECKTETYMNPTTGKNEQVINCNGQIHDQNWNIVGSKVGKGALMNPGYQDQNKYKDIHEIPGHNYNQTEPTQPQPTAPQENYAEKIRELDEAIKRNPNQANLYIQKAEIEYNIDKHDSIITLEYVKNQVKNNRIKVTHDEKEGILRRLANAYINSGQKDKGLPVLKELNKEFPKENYRTLIKLFSKS